MRLPHPLLLQMQRLVEECFGSWAPPPSQPTPPPLPNPPLPDQAPIAGRCAFASSACTAAHHSLLHMNMFHAVVHSSGVSQAG